LTVATQEISNVQIENGTIITADLADSAVTNDKIANATINASTKLVAASVAAALMAANSIAAGSIQANAVTETKILDAAITANKILDGAVVGTKLPSDVITAVKILDGAVVLGKIGTGAVNAAAIASDAVIEAKILNGAVTANKIGASAVTAGKIAAGIIADSHLSTGALHFAADTTSLANKKTIFNSQKSGASVIFTVGPSADVSAALAGETAVTSAGTTEGVIADASKNTCAMRDSNMNIITDGASHEVYGRLTESGGVWTLTYHILAPTEQAYSLTVQYATGYLLVPKRYNLNNAPEDSFRGASLFTSNVTGIAEHIAQATGAHAATAVSVTFAGFTTKNVEASLAALAGAGWSQVDHDSLRAHQLRGTAAHAASAVVFTADGAKTSALTSVQVNAAIEELHGEVEALQLNPVAATFGFKSFVATAGQITFSISDNANKPFTRANNSLMVFRGGLLQSLAAGHYTEAGDGLSIELTTAAAVDTNVILMWHK
jgi:hypothetical protein